MKVVGITVTNKANRLRKTVKHHQELICQNIIKNASVISIYDNKIFECEDIRNVYNYFECAQSIHPMESSDKAQLFIASQVLVILNMGQP